MAVNATAIWRVRPSGSNTNGGGFDSAISGAGTDYSRQNAAQASGSNATCTTGTSTFVDATANAFTSAMVGNAIWIASGTNFTVGAYFVTAFTSASTVTLDRSPVGGTSGTVGVWKLGGGWADFWTNTTSTTWLVPGNIVYILGSGTPNPASYTYDYVFSLASAVTTLATGSNTTAGNLSFLNDPATPGYKAPPDTTGGMPVIQNSGTGGSMFNFGNNQFCLFGGLYFVAGNGTGGHNTVFNSGNNATITVYSCVFDQFGFNACFTVGCQSSFFLNCECFSSTGTPGPSISVLSMSTSSYCIACNVHDCGASSGASAVDVGGSAFVLNCIIAKNSVNQAISVNNTPAVVMNNTIDGNTGDAMTIGAHVTAFICNNIFSNHTGAGAHGINAGSSITTGLVDYNSFYNNTTNYNGVNITGPHDTILAVTPYVGSATENYKLA